MVGLMPLEHAIGVRIPVSQPIPFFAPVVNGFRGYQRLLSEYFRLAAHKSLSPSQFFHGMG
jgi:hypothetical protein